MRKFSQQIFLSRFMKLTLRLVSKVTELGRWRVGCPWYCRGNEGKNIEKVGSTHDMLSVKNGKVEFFGLPWMLE